MIPAEMMARIAAAPLPDDPRSPDERAGALAALRWLLARATRPARPEALAFARALGRLAADLWLAGRLDSAETVERPCE